MNEERKIEVEEVDAVAEEDIYRVAVLLNLFHQVHLYINLTPKIRN